MDSLNISIDSLEEYLSNGNHLDLVIAVHFAGLPAEMKRLANLSAKYGFNILEDSTRTLGAKFDNGKKIGSCKYSDISFFHYILLKALPQEKEELLQQIIMKYT